MKIPYLFLVSIFVSALITWLSTMFALRRNLLDIPNGRSVHSKPVPRLGGIGILVGFFVPFMIIYWFGGSGRRAPFLGISDGIVLGVGGMATIGLFDDLCRLGPYTKLVLQVFIVGSLVASGLTFREVAIPSFGTIALGSLAIPTTVLWLIGFPNFFNFMDGTNGLAAGTAVLYGFFLACFGFLQGRIGLATIGLLLAGSSLGFMFHNFPRARTFMGDTGSLCLGMASAVLVTELSRSSRDGNVLLALFILCAVFIYDCLATLLLRLIRHENIFRPHRSHHYQRLVQIGWSHGKVAGLYFSLHLFAGLLALAYLRGPDSIRWGILALVVTLFLGFSAFVRRLENRQVGTGMVENGTSFSL